MANEFQDLFQQLFYSTEVWGYLGILFVVAFIFLITMKWRYSGVLFMPLLVMMLIDYLQQATPMNYAWHILFLGFATVFVILRVAGVMGRK